MPRPQKARPKRYKSYNHAYREENVEYDIPESTLRSQRKRKRGNDDSTSSLSGSDIELDRGVSDAVPSQSSLAGDNADRSGSEAAGDPNRNDQSNESGIEFNPNSSESSLAGEDSERSDSEAAEHRNTNHQSNRVCYGIESNFHIRDAAVSESSSAGEDTDSSGSEAAEGPNFYLHSNEQDGGFEINLNVSEANQSEVSQAEGTEGSEEPNTGNDLECGIERALSECEPEDDHTCSHEGLGNNRSNANHETIQPNELGHFGSASEPSNSENEAEQEGGGHDGSGEEHQEPDDNGDFHNIDPFSRLKAKLQDQFRNPLNKPVSLSVGEILTNALTLVRKHNWNHTETEDLMKFTNALLQDKVVPDSRFLLDQYFFSKDGMTYHFFCSKCSQLLLSKSAGSPSESHLVCPNPTCLQDNDISNLQKASFFVTFDIPYQLKILLTDRKVRSKLINPVDFISEPEDGIMRDLYHGSSYRSFAKFVHKLEDFNTKFFSFSVSVDSASLCTGFSGQSICPCFVMLNELPPVVRMKKLLIGGLWFGLVKEKLDLFLPPIVKHIIELSAKSFTLEFQDVTWHVKAYLIACVADSVARCDVQGIHSHRGDFPCNWCLCEGEEFVNCRIFPYEETLPPPRTIAELLEDSNIAEKEKRFVRGVKYLCLLAAAPMFHPVKGFIVDQMHAKDEGTSKAFLNSWLGEDGKTRYSLGPNNIKKINGLLKMAKVPRELRKAVRTLEHLSYFTGREMENWLFFLSLAVLPGALPNMYLNHWALYVQGTYLLLSSEVHSDVVKIAEDLLEEFCSKTQNLYGAHMMRFNLHILRHFAENCRRWGPMFALSAYAFERGNQCIKKLVHDCNGIPNQICRGLCEDDALLILTDACGSEVTRSFAESIEPQSHRNKVKFVGKIELLGFSKSFGSSIEERWLFDQLEVNVEECVEFALLKKDGCHYGPGSFHRQSKTDNSYARLSSKNIVRILKIVYNERTNDIWIVGNRVRCAPSPCIPSAVVRYDCSLCCQYIVTSIDEDVSVVSR